MKTKYTLFINDVYYHKRYCVVDADNTDHTVLSTDSKYEMKIWLDMTGLKILHFYSYESKIKNVYNSMIVYLV